MENGQNKTIRSFQDLRVYQSLYKSMLTVMTVITPTLPKEERFDLKDQMNRASKAAPTLIAEGFAKRYQKKNWGKYINDCIGECNEMVHHLSVCIDVYPKFVDMNLCKQLIDNYDVSCKQLTNLHKVWKNFHEND